MKHEPSARIAAESDIDYRLLVPFLVHVTLTQTLILIIRITTSYRALELGLPVIWLGIIATGFAIIPAFTALQVGRWIDRGNDAQANRLGSALVLVACIGFCAVAGLPVSFLSNYVFMYGNWGAPEMGAAAVGLTGVIVAVLHLVMIVAYVQYVPALRRYRIFARLLHFDAKMMVELFRVGIPIGMAYLFETGLFFTITLLMGILSTESLAAHNVVLNVCAVSFMIPYALSQAAPGAQAASAAWAVSARAASSSSESSTPKLMRPLCGRFNSTPTKKARSVSG